MLIEEILRSCAHEQVAQAAVSSIGSPFTTHVRDAAKTYGLTIGAFTVLAVQRFARHGDEGELRSVVSAMGSSQEPILAGLHRILCITLAAGTPASSELLSTEPKLRPRTSRALAQLCVMDSNNRRGAYC